MKRYSTVVLLLCESVLCFMVGLTIYNNLRQRRILGASPVIKIPKSSVVFTPNAKLKYFIEPAPNSWGQNSHPDWLKTYPIYTINADSLHEVKNYSEDKPPDTYRIITLGDSFTYGLFVSTKENWTELLENILNSRLHCPPYKHFDVINLAMTSYDIEDSVERMRSRGTKYQPDLVIWFLKQDDFDQINEITYPLAVEYLKKLGGDNGHIGDYITDDLRKEMGIEKITQYQTKALFDIRTYYTGKLLIYSMPGLFESSHINNKKIIENFVLHDPNASLFVSSITLRKPGVNGAFPDSHPNQKGHRIIADDIFHYLTNRNAITCAK